MLAIQGKLMQRAQSSKDNCWQDFPGGAVVRNPCTNAGDTGRSHMPRSN